MHSHTSICDASCINFCRLLFLNLLKYLLASLSIGLGERLSDSIFASVVKEWIVVFELLFDNGCFKGTWKMGNCEVVAWILNWNSNFGIGIFVEEMCAQFSDENE